MRTTKYIYAGEFESEIDFSELSRTVKAVTSEFNGKMQLFINPYVDIRRQIFRFNVTFCIKDGKGRKRTRVG